MKTNKAKTETETEIPLIWAMDTVVTRTAALEAEVFNAVSRPMLVVSCVADMLLLLLLVMLCCSWYLVDGTGSYGNPALDFGSAGLARRMC